MSSSLAADYRALVRIGKAKRVRTLRCPESGLRKGQYVVVRTERGTELARLASEPRPANASRRRLPPTADLMRLDADAFWSAIRGARAEEALESEVAGEPDRDLDAPAAGAGAAGEEIQFLRAATEHDVERMNGLLERDETEAFRYFEESVRELGLELKPIQVEVLLGGERLLCFYSSEGRVDFRELQRLLAARFQTKVEMRRIQPREAAAMEGGIGVCGRELCCSTWLKVLDPVTIKMARAQGRPISGDSNLGACGRLRCCLRYELDQYEERSGCGGCSVKA